MGASGNQKLHICHIAATSEGATWMVEQLRELRDRKGHDVSAIIAAGEGSLAERLAKENIFYQTFDFDFPPAHGWVSLLGRVIKLASILRTHRYDVVQSHLFASMIMGRLAAWVADTPVRLAMIAGPYHLQAHTPRWIDASTFWMETGLIASCEQTKNLYRELGLPDERLFKIFYGPDETKFDPKSIEPVDLAIELDLPRQSVLIGMVAYFYPRLPTSRWTPAILHDRANKRQEDLIRAAPRILSEFPDAKILLVGSGWGKAGELEMARAKKLVDDLTLQNHVLFAGYRHDVNRLLASLDVAVQASLSENLGGTIESLLMECPTIATRTGGYVDTVLDGQTGILVEPDSPESLADGVIRMLNDPVKATRMAKNGRKLMLEHFTLGSTVTNLDSLYRAQISDGTSKRRRGYRLAKTTWRSMAAIVIFPYLAVRLFWDSRVLTHWDNSRPVVREASLNSRCGTTDSAPASVRPDLQSDFSQSWRRTRGQSMRRTTRRIRSWIKLQPLFIYGHIRKWMSGTKALKLWDKFFSWLRR